MKTEILNKENFKPVAIVLTFETQKELDMIGSLFNFTAVIETLEKLGCSRVSAGVFEDAGANISNAGLICKTMREHPTLALK